MAGLQFGFADAQGAFAALRCFVIAAEIQAGDSQIAKLVSPFGMKGAESFRRQGEGALKEFAAS